MNSRRSTKYRSRISIFLGFLIIALYVLYIYLSPEEANKISFYVSFPDRFWPRETERTGNEPFLHSDPMEEASELEATQLLPSMEPEPRQTQSAQLRSPTQVCHPNFGRGHFILFCFVLLLFSLVLWPLSHSLAS
jgi:hypothetical protein